MSFDQRPHPLSHLRGRRLRAFAVSELHMEECGGRPPDPADAYTFCMLNGRYFKPPAAMKEAASWVDVKNRRVVALYEHPAFEPFDERDPPEPLALFVDKSDLGRLAPPLVLHLDPADAAEPDLKRLIAALKSGSWLAVPEGVTVAPVVPIDLLLWCPRCLKLHVDAPDPATGWTNPPHRSHLCHNCGTVWRPADVPTNGVAAIATRGEADTFRPHPVPPGGPSE